MPPSLSVQLRARMKLTVVTNFTTVNSSLSDSAVSQQEVCDDLRNLLDSQMFSDVTIQVGDERIQAHRNILAARSPVFAAMLSSGMTEGREKKIAIKDLDPKAPCRRQGGSGPRALRECPNLCPEHGCRSNLCSGRELREGKWCVLQSPRLLAGCVE